ncbi:MAG: hypothetical protein ACRETL_05925 [Gammaproteobacteria bacterium]
MEVKLYQQEGELYVLAKSGGRQAKETAMRRKRLARLLRKLRAMRKSLPKRDQLLLRMGAAKKEAGRAFGFVKMRVPQKRGARAAGPTGKELGLTLRTDGHWKDSGNGSRPELQGCFKPDQKRGPKSRAPNSGYGPEHHPGLIPIRRVPSFARLGRLPE